MSWFSKATGIHLNLGQIAQGIASVLPIPGAGLIASALGGGGGGGGGVPLPGTSMTLPLGGRTDASGYHPNVPGVDWGNWSNMGSDPFGLGISPQAGLPTNGQCPKGYHLNKSALPACKHHGPVGPRTICVRNRHMNPANGRAIGRSVRRIKAGEKQYRRVFTILHKQAAHKILPRRKK